MFCLSGRHANIGVQHSRSACRRHCGSKQRQKILGRVSRVSHQHCRQGKCLKPANVSDHHYLTREGDDPQKRSHDQRTTDSRNGRSMKRARSMARARLIRGDLTQIKMRTKASPGGWIGRNCLPKACAPWRTYSSCGLAIRLSCAAYRRGQCNGDNNMMNTAINHGHSMELGWRLQTNMKQ